MTFTKNFILVMQRPSLPKLTIKQAWCYIVHHSQNHLPPATESAGQVAGNYRADVEKLMFVNSLSIPSAPQIAIAKLMMRDSYEAHLKKLRHTLKSNGVLMRAVIAESFPAGSIQSIPSGGYVVWVQLPEGLDSLELYRQCIEKGISIAPGPIFTRKKALVNYIRLNYSHQWTVEIEKSGKRSRTVGKGYAWR